MIRNCRAIWSIYWIRTLGIFMICGCWRFNDQLFFSHLSYDITLLCLEFGNLFFLSLDFYFVILFLCVYAGVQLTNLQIHTANHLFKEETGGPVALLVHYFEEVAQGLVFDDGLLVGLLFGPVKLRRRMPWM